MISIGEINIHVTDFDRALRFWSDALGLPIADAVRHPTAASARLDFDDGSPSLRVNWPADPLPSDSLAPPPPPRISFDLTTDDFDATLARLLEAGGSLVGGVERLENLRVATVADPDGNAFELVEVPEGPPE